MCPYKVILLLIRRRALFIIYLQIDGRCLVTHNSEWLQTNELPTQRSSNFIRKKLRVIKLYLFLSDPASIKSFSQNSITNPNEDAILSCTATGKLNFYLILIFKKVFLYSRGVKQIISLMY